MPEAPGPVQGDTPFLSWAAAGRAWQGQGVSGDRATVLVSGDQVVLAAIDGLGHGPEAAEAAQRVAEAIGHDPTAPLDGILRHAHRHLSDSRGAAATVAMVDGGQGTMQWLGVGNVDGVLVRADRTARPRSLGVFLAGGVLGHNLGRLHLPDPIPLAHGDMLALATDGIQVDLAEAVRPGQPVDRLAAAILDQYARPDDDSLVLVARYHGADQPPGP